MRQWIPDFRTGQAKARDATPAGQTAAPAAPAADGDEWSEPLRAAAGDDEALLALARANSPLAVKLAAVEALQGEPALKQAEHEFRDHDRRVHRLAKQRYQQRVALREARARAATLIDAAQALARQDDIPANHLVDLDRAWRALDAELLEPAQRAEFEALMTRMAAASRERADRPQRLRRWSEQAGATLRSLEQACLDAAAGAPDRERLDAAGAAARECAAAAPDDMRAAPAAAALLAALARAEGLRLQLGERLVLLEQLLALAPPVATDPALAAWPSTADPAGTSPAGENRLGAGAIPETGLAPDVPAQGARDALQRWNALEPLGDAALDEQLRQRVLQWQRSRDDAREAQRALRREKARERQRAARDERQHALGAAIDRAEAALAGGHLAATHGHLVEVDRLIEGSAASGEIRARIDALQARYAQLKGWQHWAGGRARDELVQQAEALAALAVRTPAGSQRAGVGRTNAPSTPAVAPESPTTPDAAPDAPHVRLSDAPLDASHARSPDAPLDASHARSPDAPLDASPDAPGGVPRDSSPDAPVDPPPAAPVPPTASTPPMAPRPRGPKLTPHQLAGLIDDMRARWKELDRLGGATSRSLWQRFDGALRVAYQPVAAQVEAQRTARAENQRAREQLLAELEALPVSGADGAEPEWRTLALRVDHFKGAWRRFGPIEHTVPHQARAGLVARMEAAVQRIEAPLADVRSGARREREALVARARALAAEAMGRDLAVRARDLQAQWQQQARALPLARADEGALWTEFKAALDGAFGAREAALAARDAEFRAHASERVALITRLEGLEASLPEADLKRALAEVEAAWRRAGPAPRHEAAALEARFGRACDHLRRTLADAGQRRWQASCDALRAKLALCETLEASADRDSLRDEVMGRWSALPVLPDPLEAALAGRARLSGKGGQGGAGGAGGAALQGTAVDELLLQLEAAWGMASPADFEAARRQLKLQAMKAALETRRPAAAPAAPATAGQRLAALLQRSTLDAGQRERLFAMLDELRRRGPAALR